MGISLSLSHKRPRTLVDYFREKTLIFYISTWRGDLDLSHSMLNVIAMHREGGGGGGGGGGGERSVINVLTFYDILRAISGDDACCR